MDEDIEYYYNQRLGRDRSNGDLPNRFAEVLLNDILKENPDEDPGDPLSFLLDQEFEDKESASDDDEASDIEKDLVIEPNQMYDSDDSDDEECEVHFAKKPKHDDDYFYGRDGTKWNKTEPKFPFDLTQQRNAVQGRAGPKQRNAIPIEVFKKFFTPNIAAIIIRETNRHARKEVERFNEKHPGSKRRVWEDLTSCELDAFIGIHLAAGASCNNLEGYDGLWGPNSLPIFRATMALTRFKYLSKYLRFDDSRQRESKLKSDKAAPIRSIWNALNENLAKNYEPHDIISIEEQLFPYRGRSRFTQFVPSNAAKYGIKFWWACDAKTNYPLQGKLYTGTEEGASAEANSEESVLVQFVHPYAKTGRTIIADDLFATPGIAERLAKLGLGFIGSVRTNMNFLPREIKKSPSRPILSTLFGFQGDTVSLYSYVPKKNKALNILSTIHHSKHCVGEAMKPEALAYYQKNRTGDNSMEQLLSKFSTKRRTRRWTYAMFCNMLDVMALAAFCICKEVDGLKKPGARRKFLFSLSNALVVDNIKKRMGNHLITANYGIRVAIESFFGKKINFETNEPSILHVCGPDTLEIRKECKPCLQGIPKVRRRTRFYCCRCSTPTCLQHCKTSYTCFNCIPDTQPVIHEPL